jgi:hypothetical protein
MADDPLPHPWARATIARGTVTLNPWYPALLRGGPAGMALGRLARRGVALADLTAEGEPYQEELLVRYVGATRTPEADAALLDWAQLVGYRRVWLPDRVADLDPVEPDLGAAETACRTCRSTWRDEGPEFWDGVRHAGAFPSFCPACGSSLPEWRVRRRAAGAAAAPSPARSAAAGRSRRGGAGGRRDTAR